MLTTIKKGATGAEVSALRALLGMPDGDTFDAETVARVKVFQDAHALPVDGIVADKTWKALAKAAKTVKNGAKGAAVRALQYLLSGVPADGVFDSRTRAAVIAFQSAAKLKPDGIVGHLTWKALIVGAKEADATPAKTGFVKPKNFKQGGSPWGPKMYSSTNNKKQTYANSACGPTAAADIVATMKDKSVTPLTLGKLAVSKGYRTANSGTAWGFFKWLANKYGFRKFVQTTSIATLKAALDDGALAVASMGPGYWTKGGHFICVWKYDATYFYANDPASSVRKKQKHAAFKAQRKQFFIFWP